MTPLKQWIVVAGFVISPLTTYGTVNNDASLVNFKNKYATNLVNIENIGSSFSDYISTSLLGTQYLDNGLLNEKIYYVSGAYVAPTSSLHGNESFVNLIEVPLIEFNSIPEPRTFSMIFAGIGLMAFVTWRRRLNQL